MKPLRPRQLVHRGSVEAAAFLFPRAFVTDVEARIVERWSPGAAVYRIGDDLLLALRTAERVFTDEAPGTPLVEVDGVLFAAPLASDEREALAAGRGDVVIVRAGIAERLALGSAEPVDPAEWLDLSSFAFVPTASLGRTAVVEVVEVAAPREVRSVLADVPPLAPEAAQLMAELRQDAGATAALLPGLFTRLRHWFSSLGAGNDRTDSAGSASGRALAQAGTGTGSGGAGLLTRLLGWLVSGARGRGGAAGGAGAGPSSGAGPALRQPPGLGARLLNGARNLAARLLASTPAGRVLGRRQAQYLGEMLDMFERGDLMEALRRAIPLGALPGQVASSPALGLPTPRRRIEIDTSNSASHSSSIGLHDTVMERLRNTYRAAFERLAAQGKYQEAAFVLAELLREDEEAVAFLERHGQYRLAAELAESRELSTGLVIRQWILTGDVGRAVLIARQKNAFRDGVLQLERTHPELAATLRLLWGDSLASAGDYAAAVEAVWPLEQGRALAKAWIDRAVEGGGAAGARMLVRKLELLPDSFAEVRDDAVALLDEPSATTGETRAAFARALFKAKESEEVRVLARPALRAMVRDAAAGCGGLTEKELPKLVALVDGALANDLPKNSARPTGARPPLELRIEAGDRGTLHLVDAAVLPNGRLLVALGEAGVRLLRPDGSLVWHCSEPAHHLVVADNGNRAIALARRGEVHRLSRLELVERRAASWCEAKMTRWDPTYDGSSWFVSVGDRLMAIDTLSDRFRAIWHVDKVGSGILALGRSSQGLGVLVRGDSLEEQELWHYALPSLRLNLRQSTDEPGRFWPGAVTGNGTVAGSWDGLGGSGYGVGFKRWLNGAPVRLDLGSAMAAEGALSSIESVSDLHFAWAAFDTNAKRTTLMVFDTSSPAVLRARMVFEGTSAHARIGADSRMVIRDSLGRLLVFNAELGRLEANLRL